MNAEFSGIERRLDELSERLARLEPLQNKTLEEFNANPYLKDIVERNLEVAAQCCIDICNRIIPIVNLPKPVHEYLKLDWEMVFDNLKGIVDLEQFRSKIRILLPCGTKYWSRSTGTPSRSPCANNTGISSTCSVVKSSFTAMRIAYRFF